MLLFTMRIEKPLTAHILELYNKKMLTFNGITSRRKSNRRRRDRSLSDHASCWRHSACASRGQRWWTLEHICPLVIRCPLFVLGCCWTAKSSRRSPIISIVTSRELPQSVLFTNTVRSTDPSGLGKSVPWMT